MAARWLLATDTPPRPPFHLPAAHVSALSVGERVLGIDGTQYVVTAVGPGALVLEAPGHVLCFTNRGYRSYSWAFFAAPLLHWVLDD